MYCQQLGDKCTISQLEDIFVAQRVLLSKIMHFSRIYTFQQMCLKHAYSNKYVVRNILMLENTYSRIFLHIPDNEHIPTLRPSDTQISLIKTYIHLLVGRICPIPKYKFSWPIFFNPWQYISNTKMPKIDTLDALEEHEEHDDDYQTITNWNANW